MQAIRMPALAGVTSVLLGLWSTAALPQAYPAKPIKLFVSTGPGAPPDILARLLGDKLTGSLGQPVVVENRPGASGTIGMNSVAKAAPDGYTLGILSVGYVTAPSLIAQMPYDTEKDLAPVTLIGRDSNLLVVPSGSSAKSVAELIATAKAKPGFVKFASGGNSTPAHLAGELFRRETGVDITHIPYKTPAAGATAVLTGEVDMMFGTTPAVAPHIKSGKLRVLASSTAQRVPAFPEVPTLVELGYPNVVFSGWFGVVAPTGTPKDIVARLYLEIQKIGATQETRQRLEAIGMESATASPEELGALIRVEFQKWNKLVRDAGIKPG